MLSDFWLSFIPLFIAFDVFGVLPLYIRFIHRLDDSRRKRNLRDSLITAFFTALLFVIMGSKVMEYLGISIEDFLIAGGIVLFIIAAKYIIVGQDENLEEDEMYGVVPLGVPLLSGPAVLATSIIIRNQYGFTYFFVSLALNLVICAVVLKFSQYIIKYLGKRFVEALSKVFSLIIASIAIMFIRKGLQGLS
ncbi:MAG TPA: MarC family protein [Syntrophorhabdus sp.]|jgi:multiple antibiotic resistance protein|nr:MarC family protein [Syntrophorhabdus sp.]OPX93041.1 MAG: putative antibiotic transporter [Syntrophorhabdus sp. PtaB.Bin027]HNS79513.1 MarC family protein [Syntrophorhabdus sp.]HPB37809.1 MarC family protein [Syntrophorhabdus sp.]HPW35193.1 MarC family protein [Syntrophorhabdus sp.]